MLFRRSPLELVRLFGYLLSPGLDGVGGSSASGLRPPCVRFHSIASSTAGLGVSCACVSRTSGITAVAPGGPLPSWSPDESLHTSIPFVTYLAGFWIGTVGGHLGPVVAAWIGFFGEGNGGDVPTPVAPDNLEEGRLLLLDSSGELEPPALACTVGGGGLLFAPWIWW